jgi:hypothetical protein
MIFRRIVLALCTASAFMAGTATSVVAAAFALYAIAEPRLGRAGSAAMVAGAMMVMMMIAGLVAALAGRARRRRPLPSDAASVLDRTLAFIRGKPVLTASAAIGVGLMAARNPKYLGEAIRAFLDGKSSK